MESKISIILPVGPISNFLSRAIESIDNQNFNLKNIQLVIIDDYKKNRNLLKNIKINNIKNIKYIHHHSNSVAHSRNIGVINSEFNLISFLDADDEWLKNKIKQDLKYINRFNADLFYSNYNIIKKNKAKKRNSYQVQKKNLTKFVVNNPIGFSTITLKKKIFKELGLFKTYKVRSDHDFILRFLNNNYKMKYIKNNIYLTNYYKVKNSLSSKKFLALLYFFKINLLYFGIFKGIFLTLNYVYFHLFKKNLKYKDE